MFVCMCEWVSVFVCLCVFLLNSVGSPLASQSLKSHQNLTHKCSSTLLSDAENLLLGVDERAERRNAVVDVAECLEHAYPPAAAVVLRVMGYGVAHTKNRWIVRRERKRKRERERVCVCVYIYLYIYVYI